MSDYQIGQYRFSDASSCLTNISASKLSSGYATTSAGFKDLQITYSDGFSVDTDYYLYMRIPQSMNYDYTFTLKLVRADGSTDTYQYLDTIEIPKGGDGNSAYNVVLYAIPGTSSEGNYENEKVKAMIPNVYNRSTSSTKDELYLDSASGTYYVGTSGGKYEKTTKYNDVFLDALWRSEQGKTYGWFELTFRPVEAGFSKLLLEMSRTGTDWNIQNSDDSYGRIIDPDDVTVELKELKNLVDQINPKGTLSKIGVWGHSGLMMAINGETIRVGQSSYYEYDTIPIESLGVVAQSFEDNFTIDWMYEIGEEE